MQWLPEGWKPKAIAVDIDGTLTDENKKINTEAIEALRDLEVAGFTVILATGNVRAITYGLWRFIGLSGPMICENGGVVWHPDWAAPIVRADGTRAKQAAEMLASKLNVNAEGITTNAWRESEWCLFPDEDVDVISNAIANSEFSDLSVVKTGFAIHLMESHLSKGEGLKVVLDKLGLAPSEILAIGDAPNDISMFKNVGHSIAVGGCFNEVAAIADVVSPYMHGETFAPLVKALLNQSRQ
ncbi:MAG: phosphoglycolate phosphatase [Candidatus Poseidoniaceae archaeon]|jgi:hypothetical protein|nr:phosphoglycolate phosphatase [Candidatus Poseidoniaceae archaeon]